MTVRSDVLLEFRNISKSFPGVKALDDVSFSVRRGHIHALLGENGAGKSTIIKILTGVHTADNGSIVLDGREIAPENIMESRGLGIGTVFQENSLVPHLDVAENIFLTREIKNSFGLIDWKRSHQECRKQINELGIDLDTRKKVREYSVAQQQIIEIVKVFSQNPRLVILDEPTSALSDNEIDNLFRIVRRLRDKGITFFFISHRMDEIQQLCDAGTVLRDGKFVATLDDIAGARMDDIIQMMVGRNIDDVFPTRDVQPGEEYFQVRNLTVPDTIYDVNLSVRRGEVLGLAGLVGSGRTSIAKAIIGAIPKSAGSVSKGGRVLDIQSPQDAIRHGIGYLPEDRKAEGLLLDQTLVENITLPSLPRYRRFWLLQYARELDDTREYVAKLSVKTPGIHQKTRFLSGGNQQKVVFSKWLCAHSDVYIFDEPTRGIDVGAKREMYGIINDLAAQGAAIVVISSELPEILGLSDRIAVMCEGRMMGELSRREATQEKIMRLAFGTATTV